MSLRPLVLSGAVAAVIAASTVAALAISGDEPVASPPLAGACHESEPDCVDTVDPGDGDATFDPIAARTAAEALVGTPESELSADVRVARRGDETFALTEDYVLGRMTVELDADGDGVFRVTEVVVELPEGPATFAG